jgi:hypothetical protein
MDQCNKTSYSCDLWPLLISWSVCPWQAFQTDHSKVGSLPYPQTLEWQKGLPRKNTLAYYEPW